MTESHSASGAKIQSRKTAIDFFLFFSSRGNVIFLFVIVLNSSRPSKLCKKQNKKKNPLFNSSNSGKNTNKTKTNTEGFIRPEQKHCFSSMGTNLPSLSSSLPLPKASQELTINTSLWTANRNRIHTMNIFIINSSAFYKLFALYESLFIGHSSCDSWWSPLHYCPLDASPSIIAQEGPKAQGCVSWLWYKRDQLLVATAKCEGRAESGLILQMNRKLHPGEPRPLQRWES